MERNPITWLCVNQASGSNDTERVRAVAEALEAAGADVLRLIDVRSEGLPQSEELDRAGVELLVVYTGDGTANSIVASLEGWGGKVLILPGGTANLLCRSLHGECDAVDIVKRLPTMRPIRRPCIRTSQGIAIIEVLAGPGATWSDVREELREGDLPAVAASSLAAIRQSTTGAMVAIIEPPLGKADGYSGVRLEAATDGMVVEGYGADTVGDYLKQGVALLRRDFRQGPHDDLGIERDVVCHSLGEEPIELMIDGERRTGALVERFSLAELDLDLLATA